MLMTTSVSSETDLLSLFASNSSTAASQRTNAMSPTNTELSDDSLFNDDDIVVLSDMLGLPSSQSNAESSKSQKSTSSRPRNRKRPRPALDIPEGMTPPKSQQQRQKMEIAYLKQQIVDMEATVERLQARKLERERLELEKLESNAKDQSMNAELFGLGPNQVDAVQKLEEQNEKLRNQVAKHLGELKKLEMIARDRLVSDAL